MINNMRLGLNNNNNIYIANGFDIARSKDMILVFDVAIGNTVTLPCTTITGNGIDVTWGDTDDVVTTEVEGLDHGEVAHAGESIGQTFDVLDKIAGLRCSVYAKSTGTLTYIIKQGIITVFTETITAIIGKNVLELPALEPGDYSILITENVASGCIRESSGASYPYESERLSITGTTFVTDQTRWYFFYDWEYDISGTQDDHNYGGGDTVKHTYVSAGEKRVVISASEGGGLSAFGNNTLVWSSGAEYLTKCLSFGTGLGLILLKGAFRNCINLTKVPRYLPASITDLYRLFSGCASLVGENMKYWDMSNVTSLSSFVVGCDMLDNDIGDWNVLSVTLFRYAFNGCDTFNKNLGSWKLRPLGVDCTAMLLSSGMSVQNTNLTVCGWANWVQSISDVGGSPKLTAKPSSVTLGLSQTLTDTDLTTTDGYVSYSDSMPAGTSSFTNAVNGAEYLIDTCGWTITPSPLNVVTPTISAEAGGTEDYIITLSTTTDGATIYYTTDGSTPDDTDNEYTGTFEVADTDTVKAIAIKSGWNDSSVVEALPQTIAYIAKVEDIGGSALSSTNLSAINTLLNTLIDNSILSKLDTLNVVGYDVASMKVNLADPTVTASFVNITDGSEDSDFVSNVGVSGGTGKYIDLNINIDPSGTTGTIASKFIDGKGSLGVFETVPLSGATCCPIGASAFHNSMAVITGSGNWGGRIFSNTFKVTSNAKSTVGLRMLSRNATDNLYTIDNGLKIATLTSTGYDTSSYIDGNVYGIGLPTAQPVVGGKIGAFIVGGYMESDVSSTDTDAYKLYDALNTYFLTIGAIE